MSELSTIEERDPRSPYQWIGGADAVHALVERFYDLMELEPAYGELRALHPDSTAGSREKLFAFLSGWMGGPDLYVQQHGHPRLRARHLPYSIGVLERNQWLACMAQALREREVDPLLATRLEASFANTADWMRNRSA